MSFLYVVSFYHVLEEAKTVLSFFKPLPIVVTLTNIQKYICILDGIYSIRVYTHFICIFKSFSNDKCEMS